MTAQTFSKDTFEGTTDEMREGMYTVSQKAIELEKDKNERLKRKAQEEKARAEAGVAPLPVRRKREETQGERSDTGGENTDADFDYWPDSETSTTKKTKRTTTFDSLLDTKEYRTTAADREERMRQRAEAEGTPIPDSTQHVTPEEEEEETEESLERKRLEKDIEKQQKELKKLERKKQQEEVMTVKQKAKAFQEVILGGKWQSGKNTPKIVSAEKRKKSTGFTQRQVKQEEEEAEEEEEFEDQTPLPEGFHLLSDDVHCKNIRRAEGFIFYLRAITSQFEDIVRKGTNVPSNYNKLIKSVYWACRAVGVTSVEEADAEEVFDNIKDKTCRAWMLHLRGIPEATSYDLLPAAQKESFITRDSSVNADMEAKIKEECRGMTGLQETTTRNLIKDLCYHNKMAHRHAMESAEKLETLSMNVSLPFFLQLAEGTSRALIQLNLPSVQEHMEKAEKERKQREMEYSSTLEPTIGLAAKLSLVQMNESWRDSTEGRANRILASFVNRYVYDQMHRHDGKVLSAKVLADRFELKESTLGKLLTARRFLGGRETMFLKKRRASAEDDEDE